MRKLNPATRPALLLVIVGLSLPACSRGEQHATIQNRGSDTLVNVAQAWSESFMSVDPSIAVVVTGGGSGTGIAAMINGTIDIANSSREMTADEIAAAKKRGVDPIKHVVGFDALAVFVNKKNPVKELTLKQLAEMYGENGTITKWSDIGVTVPGADEIILISRQNNSGTYVYFQETVIGEKRDFRQGTRDMHASKDVVDLVEHTPGAIGYSGLAYATDHVRMVPIVSKGSVAVMPSVDSAVDGSYPIARPLMMYTKGQPEGMVKTYLDWILSDAGQRIILEKEYAPVRKLDP